MLLFPELKSGEEAEGLLTKLLENGDLEPDEKERENPGEAWTISYESWEIFEAKTLHEREEVRKNLLLELLEQQKKIEQDVLGLKRDIKELKEEIKKLQADKEEWDKEDKVKEIIEGH